MKDFPVSRDDMRAAASKLDGVVIRTPLLENPDVNAMLAGRLLLKAENLQRTGAFKIRGAYHRMLGLTAEERARGAVTYSSGNHALGLARAAQILGSSAVIVMPSDAPAAKMAAVRDMGAEIVAYNRDTQNSADVVARIMAETGRIEVPPSAHPAGPGRRGNCGTGDVGRRRRYARRGSGAVRRRRTDGINRRLDGGCCISWHAGFCCRASTV